MAQTKRQYRKLPGTGRGLIARHRMYLAEDHLLCVETIVFIERYCWFDLGDIQAITARATKTWSIYLAIYGLGLALCLSLLVTRESLGVQIFLGIVAGGMGMIVLGNLLMGPTCASTLTTSVTTQSLPSLGRLRTFRKVSEVLVPLIETRQGRMDPERLRGSGVLIVDEPNQVPVKPDVIGPALAVSPEPYRGGAILWLSLALLFDVVAGGIMFLIDVPASSVLKLIAALLITGLVVVGFAKVAPTPAARSARRMLWAGLGYSLYTYVWLYALFLLGSMNSELLLGLPSAGSFAAMLPSHSPVSQYGNIASMVVSFILAVIGLFTYLNARAPHPDPSTTARRNDEGVQ